MLATLSLTPYSPALNSDLSLLLRPAASTVPLLGGKDTGSSLRAIYDTEKGRGLIASRHLFVNILT